ncbi:unnamed protein product [Urochloa humidicola]
MWTEAELARMSEEKQRGIRAIRAKIQAFKLKGYSEETLRLDKLMFTDPGSRELRDLRIRQFEESVGLEREVSRRQWQKEMEEADAARGNAGVHMEEAAAVRGNAGVPCSSHGRDAADCPNERVKRQRVMAPPTDMDLNISRVGEDGQSGRMFLS